MSAKGEIAKNYFLNGYNCSQAVLLAFADDLGLDTETAAKLASAFGGGMGRLREVCGAVSGMFMVIGLKYGYDNPKAYEIKKKLYSRIQLLAERFKEENGSIICRELLGLQSGASEPVPELRTQQYYKKRPCAELVRFAAELTEEYIQNNGQAESEEK